MFVLFLNADGTVQSSLRLTSEFTGLASGDLLGSSLAPLGDWDGDGRPDLAVAATLRDGPPSLPDYASLQDAIAAAPPEATVLVHGGLYYATTVIEIAKPLTIQAANPGNARVQGSLKVRDLSSSQSVVLGGLTLLGDYREIPLELVNDDGPVWIDDCLVAGENGCHDPGLRVVNCADVILNRTRVVGTRDIGFSFLCDWMASPARPGLELSGGSRVHAFECVFTGADGVCECIYGYPYCDNFGQVGGTGIVNTSADFLFLSGCLVKGGTGGCAGSSGCEAGGNARQTVGPLKALDTTFHGGQGCPNGGVGTGPVTVLPGASLSMAVNNPTRENEATLFTFEGPPGAAVYVLYSLEYEARYRPALQGTDLLGEPRFLDVLGAIGADGRLESVEHLGPLPPSYDILHLYAQAYYMLPASASFPRKVSAFPRVIQLGTGAAVQRLDETF